MRGVFYISVNIIIKKIGLPRRHRRRGNIIKKIELPLAHYALVSINISRPPSAGGKYNIDYTVTGGVAM